MKYFYVFLFSIGVYSLSSAQCNLSASFNFNVSGGFVYLTNTSTNVPTNAQFDWWYGSQNSSAENPVFTQSLFDEAVCLTIYDSNWVCTDSVCSIIYADSTFTGCNLNASFTYNLGGGNIYFTSTSTNVPSNAQYDWWYGTQNSNQENPVFTQSATNEVVCLTVYDSNWVCYDSICTYIYADSSVLGEMSLDEVSLKIYPTVFTSQLNITIPSSENQTQIFIYNVNGDIVFTTRLESTSYLQTIETGNLSSGFYTISVVNEDWIYSQKIIKQ